MDSAQVDIWDCALAFVPLAVVKCAIELGIADVLLETPMSNSDLSSALNCSPPILLRIMRYLIHRGFFKEEEESSVSYYTHTPLSRLLVKTAENNMSALVLLESSPVMLGPWHQLSSRALANGPTLSPFEAANGGEGVWEYAARNPAHSKLLNEAMACRARVDVLAMIDQCPEVFKGVDGCLVDVGGGDGTAVRTLVKAFPCLRGINFDLPHVVSGGLEGVEHVAGDMFQSVPKADAAFLMSVLHDWSDEECVQILSKCREAIPEGTGKVIIAEGVIRDQGEKEDKYKNIRLGLDIVMLAHTGKGKERTTREWEYVVKEAGFASCTIKHIDATISVIQAYP